MKSNSEIKLIAVVGPTGSGKTALAVELAKQFNAVIISADSRQVYKGLDIGTNKEGEPGEWRGQPCRMIDNVPQLLIDAAEPTQLFTLANWLELAKAAIQQVDNAGQLPIITGGTGLYVSALLSGYQLGGGRYATAKTPPPYRYLVIQPHLERAVLYQKNNERYEKIFTALAQEVRELLGRGVPADWLEKIGLDYRFAAQFVLGQVSQQEAITKLQNAGRAYIRRQLTWWRHHEPVAAVYSAQEAAQTVALFLKKTDRARTLKA